MDRNGSALFQKHDLSMNQCLRFALYIRKVALSYAEVGARGWMPMSEWNGPGLVFAERGPLSQDDMFSKVTTDSNLTGDSMILRLTYRPRCEGRPRFNNLHSESRAELLCCIMQPTRSNYEGRISETFVNYR